MAGLVIVTGGSRGIGAAICKRLAEDGHAVAVNYASNQALAQGVVEAITTAGGKAKAFQADASDERGIEQLFDAAQQEFGPVAGLVSNAGIVGTSGRVDELSAEALVRTFAVNVFGPILATRAAIRLMSTRHGGQGGSIVILSSVAARLGAPGELVHYAASKGAIDSFTLGVGREVADEGIRVNAVAPGLIDTEMNSSDRQARVIPNIPIKRAGLASEVAEAVAWLISPASSYVTGTTLTVSGGR